MEGFSEMTLDRIQREPSTLLLAVSDSYKVSTSQHLTRKLGSRDRKVATLRNSLPPPDSSAYKATLGLLKEALESQVASARAK